MEDEKIIDLYWKREESAINETENKYGGYLKKIAYNILYNNSDSEECVNDTYLKAWNAMPEERPKFLSAFLGKITRNNAINKYNNDKALKRGANEITIILNELEEIISENSVEKEIEKKILTSLINDFLKSEKEDNRKIFIRRYWYSCSVSDVSKFMNISESKVKSVLFRMRKRLKEYLEKEGISV